MATKDNTKTNTKETTSATATANKKVTSKTPTKASPKTDVKTTAKKTTAAKTNNQEQKNYSADSIEILEGLEAVRKRPGMYIGGTDSKGLHHLIWEIVDNAKDEALAGYCNEILIEVFNNGVVSITDNGRGIPIDKHSKTGEPAIYSVFETLHAGGKFGGEGYKVSGGLHGVGASVTNALSSFLDVEVYKNGYIHTMSYKESKRHKALKKGAKTNKQGTKVTWKYDEKIFNKNVGYDALTIEQRLREASFLVKNVKFILVLEGKAPQIFLSKEGLAEMVKELAYDRQPLHTNPLYFNVEEYETKMADDNPVELNIEIALQWGVKSSSDERIYSFANTINTSDGGSHVSGLKASLTRVFNNYGIETNKLKKDKTNDRLQIQDILSSLTAAISVHIQDPQFEGQTKGRLNNTEAKSGVQSYLYVALSEWFENKKNAKDAKVIFESAMHARKIRLAKTKVSKNYNPNSIFSDLGTPSKLADCESTLDPEERELFLTEGDSAGGTCIAARDGIYQAILPVKGKSINVMKATNKKIFENDEIKTLVMTLGGRIDQLAGENVVTLDKIKYGKIVIAADADTDGGHIICLLLAVFYELFPNMIKEGRIFVARPPLFKINLDSKGEKVMYAYPEEDLNSLLKKHKRTGEDVTRFKGLGEMNADHLAETVMVKETRKIVQVSIEDAAEAAEAFALVLGDSPARRKQWLESGALKRT